MKKILKNKQVFLATLVLVIVVAGAVNWAAKQYSFDEAVPVSAPIMESGEIMDQEVQDEVPESDEYSVTEQNYFSGMRMERETGRGKELAIHKETINNPNSATEAKNNAQTEINRIAKAIETETTIESLIKSKGFSNAFVMIGKESVNVIIKADELLSAQVAQIKDIVMDKTGLAASKIKISQAK